MPLEEVLQFVEAKEAGKRSASRLHDNKMKMNAANNQSIKILGAVILHISGRSREGEPRTTKQFTYVTNDSDKFYLSKGACIYLGMISDAFPSIGETAALDNKPSANQGSTTTSSKEPSSCPKQVLPRPLPTKMQFCYRREQGETTTLPAGFLQRQHLQYLRAPSTTTHDRHTSEAHDCRGCKTNGVSFSHPGAHTLARRRKSRFRPGRTAWCYRTSSSR